MAGIIVVFPNKDNAVNIRNLLVKGGLSVAGIGTTGAQAMQYADAVDDGIVICGYKLKDMMYTELREYLPDQFEMLLVASQDKWSDGLTDRVVGLTMPFKVYDLINTVEMMLGTLERRRRRRKKERGPRDKASQEQIKKAKELLMARNHMTEEEAHKYLQKSSMDSGTNIVETASMVLSIMAD